MKKIFIALMEMFLLLVSFTIKLSNYKNENLIQEFDSNKISHESLNYLNSYDDVDLKVTNYDLIFNGILNANFLDNKINQSLKVNLEKEKNNDLNEYLINFKTIYVQELNIIYMKVDLIRDNISLDEINIFGIPFYNEKINTNDVKFEYFGKEILASSLNNNETQKVSLKDNTFFILNSTDENSGYSPSPKKVNVTEPILKISSAVANSSTKIIDQKINILKNLSASLFKSNPVFYVINFLKNIKAFENYENNRKLALPKNSIMNNYITNQHSFETWKFGFQSFDNNGCGIISIYNFLVSQNKTPWLASLILLCELMNADLGLGFLGVSPLDNLTLKLLPKIISGNLILITPFLHAQSPMIAANITKALIDFELSVARNIWAEIAIYASIPLQAAITLAAVNAAIIIVVSSINILCDFYLANVCGIPDILNVFAYYSLDKYYFDYDNFEKNAILKKYFIITYFNDESNILKPETLSAHTIFIESNFEKEKSYKAYNNAVTETKKFLYEFIKFDNKNLNTRLITGIIIK